MAWIQRLDDAIDKVARQMVTVPPEEGALDRILAALPARRGSAWMCVRRLLPRFAAAAAAAALLVWAAHVERTRNRMGGEPQVRVTAPAPAATPPAAPLSQAQAAAEPAPRWALAPVARVDLVRERDLPPVPAPVELFVNALAPEALVVRPRDVAPLVVEALSVEPGR